MLPPRQLQPVYKAIASCCNFKCACLCYGTICEALCGRQPLMACCRMRTLRCGAVWGQRTQHSTAAGGVSGLKLCADGVLSQFHRNLSLTDNQFSAIMPPQTRQAAQRVSYSLLSGSLLEALCECDLEGVQSFVDDTAQLNARLDELEPASRPLLLAAAIAGQHWPVRAPVHSGAMVKQRSVPQYDPTASLPLLAPAPCSSPGSAPRKRSALQFTTLCSTPLVWKLRLQMMQGRQCCMSPRNTGWARPVSWTRQPPSWCALCRHLRFVQTQMAAPLCMMRPYMAATYLSSTCSMYLA